MLGFDLHELITGGPRFYSLLRISFSNPAEDAGELIFTETPTAWKFYRKFGLSGKWRRIHGSQRPLDLAGSNLVGFKLGLADKLRSQHPVHLRSADRIQQKGNEKHSSLIPRPHQGPRQGPRPKTVDCVTLEENADLGNGAFRPRHLADPVMFVEISEYHDGARQVYRP